MHFGIISPPVSGHIHPFGALGRELIRRGHRVSFLQMADVAERVQAEGLEFLSLGQTDHPLGSLPQSLHRLGQLQGFAALRFTIQAISKTTEMICRDAPAVIHQKGIEVLLVDQTEPAGATVAEHLGLPFITICNALALSSDPHVPPPFTAWNYQTSWWAGLRNRAGYWMSRRMMMPVEQVVQRYRQVWGLRKYAHPEESFSKLAQISQQPKSFDFPRHNLPEIFHYAGPFRDNHQQVDFPWEKLDGRPLIYASLGTLQNQKEPMFRSFAESCQDLHVQLVMTHGGGLSEETAASFPGNPLVVRYAPQLPVLAHACLTLTHAGLNTVLDSLTCGVPMVAIPITYEQPAIASRIRWSGTGKTLPLSRLRSELRSTINQVLEDGRYRVQAQRLQKSIGEAGGVQTAANIIEQAIA